MLVHTGTAASERDPEARPDIPRLSDAEPSYPLILKLHERLLGLGASAAPSSREKGTTLYAAIVGSA